MATIKQRKALDRIVENGGNVSRAMMEVGYTPATAKTPQKLTESLGFRQLCEERGLTEKFLVDALVEDIQLKPQNRKAELELGLKIIGKLTETPQQNNTLVLVLPPEIIEKNRLNGTP